MNTTNLNDSYILLVSCFGKEKYCVLYLPKRNLRGSHFGEPNPSRNIHISQNESFMYGLPDFPRNGNALLGSMLTIHFKQI